MSRAGGGQSLPEVEAEQVGAGKDDETEGLGRLGGKLRRRNWRQGLTGASRPDITGSEAIPLCESVAGGVECNGTPTDTVSRSWTRGFERMGTCSTSFQRRMKRPVNKLKAKPYLACAVTFLKLAARPTA